MYDETNGKKALPVDEDALQAYTMFFKFRKFTPLFIEGIIKLSVELGVEIVPIGNEPFIKCRKENS